ncbi:hypothetical protein SAY86_019514 [Trapa natans]|uniref:LYR motif containing domain-containing protein n=1 Tax=Trapa natans TaxID=22666 RepID=A0AAN7R4S7_TRANT|nr:hypothetical protein SAY86_019514 [Trapa natans]
MAKGLIWATAEDLASNRARVLSLYRQILRSLNSADLPLSFMARSAKKAEARAIFVNSAVETSIHNIEELIECGEYTLSLLKKGEVPDRLQRGSAVRNPTSAAGPWIKWGPDHLGPSHTLGLPRAKGQVQISN